MKTSTKKSLISVAVVLVLVLALTCVLAACGNKPNAPTSDPKAASFVNIDVNPSLELVLDENNMVLDVQAANSDAEVLIHNQDGIVGSSLDVAVKNIGKLSVKMGYVSEDNNHINISVAADANIDTKAIRDSVEANIKAGVNESAALIGQAAANIDCIVDQGVDIAYTYELAAIKEKYGLKDDDLDLPRYRLIRSAMLHKFGLTFTKALELTNGELAEIITEEKADFKAEVDSAKAVLYKNAKLAYENAKSVSKDLAYLSKNHFVESSLYISAHIYELCMKHAYETYTQDILNKEYTENEVKLFASAMFNDETALDNAKDENGKWTKQSISQFVNKEFRNMVEDKQIEFNNNYKEVQKSINDELLKDYKIEAKIDTNDFTTNISASFKLDQQIVDNINDSMTEVLNLLNKFTLPSSKPEVKFENKIITAEKNTKNCKEALLKELTDEEKDAVAKNQEKYDNLMQEVESGFKSAQAQFNTAANDWLEKEQAARLATYEANQAK